MAIGYIRVSTEGQAGDDRYGIVAQRDAIEQYAFENGFEIEDFIIDTVSGVKDDREGFDKILYELETDAVIVYKSDRVARDTKLYFYYLYTLEKRGIKLISVNEHFEDDGLANIYRAILQFVAEQERKNIKMRTEQGRRAKAAQGGYSGGRPPLGYFTANGKLYKETDEALIVRKIFEMNAEQWSLCEIAKQLNYAGHKTKMGKKFSYPTVLNVIRNRKIYEGYMWVDNKWIKGTQEIIIGEDEFHRPDGDFVYKKYRVE